MKRWKKLNMDQLVGAHYGLRIFRTWPALNRNQVDKLDGLLIEIASEVKSREKMERKSSKNNI